MWKNTKYNVAEYKIQCSRIQNIMRQYTKYNVAEHKILCGCVQNTMWQNTKYNVAKYKIQRGSIQNIFLLCVINKLCQLRFLRLF